MSPEDQQDPLVRKASMVLTLVIISWVVVIVLGVITIKLWEWLM